MPARSFSKEFRDEVVDQVKSSGKSAGQVAQEYGINVKNIYNWLRSSTFKDANVLEINKLRREKQELLEIIGKLTVNLSRGEKNRYDNIRKTD